MDSDISPKCGLHVDFGWTFPNDRTLGLPAREGITVIVAKLSQVNERTHKKRCWKENCEAVATILKKMDMTSKL